MGKKGTATTENATLKNKIKKVASDFRQFHMSDLFLMIYDIIAVTVAFFLALWLRFDCRFTEIPKDYLMAWVNFAPIYAVCSLVVFKLFHLYQSIWKYAGLVEVKMVLYSSVVLAVIHTAAITLLFGRMPISYYIAGSTIQFLFISFARFFWRFIALEKQKKEKLFSSS